MSSEPVTDRWVVCPSCHKADTSGAKYCQRCWGAVLHPEIEMTPEEEGEVERRRQVYLKRRKMIKIATIGLSSLSAILAIYLGLYYLTDTVYSPPSELNSNSAPGDWAMFGNNLGHTGSPESDGAVPQGNLKWTFSTDGPIHSSPAISGGKVFFGSQDYNFYVLDAETGDKEWEFSTRSWVQSSPAVSGGMVYFGSNDSNLYALNTENGEVIWEFNTRFPIESAPSIAGDVVYFGADDYYIYALDKESGKKLWSFDTGGTAKSSPVISEGILYTGSGGSGYSFAINAENGLRRLRFKSHYTVYNAPAVNEGIVYFVTANGMIYAVDGKARTWLREHEIRPLWTQMWLMGIPAIPQPPDQSGLLWTYQLGSSSSNSPVISGDTLYIGADWKLVAIDIPSQEKLWEFETGGTVRSTPALVGDTIFVGSEDGRLYALDAATGEKRWDYLTGDKITSSPAVANGIVYIASHDGNIYAFE
ncbi:MAG: PQQ-binding-like beta-propeller repeat protein [Dehalococcoidales bacterium]